MSGEAPGPVPAGLLRYWYPVCLERELGAQPLARSLAGRPLVVFRGREGRAGVLVDCCPHRGAPLSRGRLVAGELQCPYHGWRFDVSGTCTHVPALRCVSDADAGSPAHASAVSLPVSVSDGCVWVRADGARDADPLPALSPVAAGAAWIRRSFTLDAPLGACAENILDVPHTAFVHGGLFRSAPGRREVEVRIRRRGGAVEAEYRGEPRPRGLLGRLLAPSGGEVRHWDRFRLPGVTEVEYHVGATGALRITSFLTPLDDARTLVHAIGSVKIPWWLRAFLPLFMPVVGRVVAQDQRILRAQTANLSRFPGWRFRSTELDRMSVATRSLLERATRGEPVEEEEEEREHVTRAWL